MNSTTSLMSYLPSKANRKSSDLHKSNSDRKILGSTPLKERVYSSNSSQSIQLPKLTEKV
jgi:hypothetical protein